MNFQSLMLLVLTATQFSVTGCDQETESSIR